MSRMRHNFFSIYALPFPAQSPDVAALFGTRGKYIPVRSTAASLLLTVLQKDSDSCPAIDYFPSTSNRRVSRCPLPSTTVNTCSPGEIFNAS